jgi:SAM-dependent methyltransferase
MENKMKLTSREFNAMNTPLRRLVQRLVEYPNFRRMGMRDEGGDILEIGCGSGYGAQLLSRLHPHSYEGVDLMPEQIALAQKAACGLDGYVFRVSVRPTASSLKARRQIFGVPPLPGGRRCGNAQVLRDSGKLFLEKPDSGWHYGIMFPGTMLPTASSTWDLGAKAPSGLQSARVERARFGIGQPRSISRAADIIRADQEGRPYSTNCSNNPFYES